MTVEKGKIHVLGEALSRAPHAPHGPEINTSSVTTVSLSLQFQDKYEQDAVFGPIFRGLKGIMSNDAVQKERVKRLLPLFQMKDGNVIYDGLTCVPRCSVKELMHLAHDAKISGHFSFSKTLARLKRFHWRNKLRDIQDYCKGCITCQQQKDSRQKPL